MKAPHCSQTEFEMIQSIVRDARHRYGRSAVFALELRSHGRAKTDLVVYFSGLVIAIEAKVEKWKRAMVQAVLNKYYADESYVALSERHLSERVIDEARRFQLGVIAVNGDRVWVAHPAVSLTPNRVLRTRVVEGLLSAQRE